MTVSTFDPAGWLARATALGRHVEVVGPVVYFGRARHGTEAEDAALFAELRAAGGVKALRPHLIRRASRLARLAITGPVGRNDGRGELVTLADTPVPVVSRRYPERDFGFLKSG